jgi:hypothetical protein
MYSLPFDDYLKTLNPPIKFSFHTTACWRGYYGTWEISNIMLFLTFLQAYISMDPKKVLGIRDFFPESTGKVKAEWFSGTIRIPLSGQSEYYHGGFGYSYDSFLHIEVVNGDVISTGVFTQSENENEKTAIIKQNSKKHFRIANVISWFTSKLK